MKSLRNFPSPLEGEGGRHFSCHTGANRYPIYNTGKRDPRLRGDDGVKGTRGSRGFTLVELAIGMAVLGLLFAGVWELLSSMNQQLQDQAIARQARTIAEAAHKYVTLEKPENKLASNIWHTIPIRDNGDPSNTELQPRYLSASTSDTNALGQTYKVFFRHKDGVKETFVTATGAPVPLDDLRASRLASMIGADGGVLYSDEAVKGNAGLVRGAYGGWQKPRSELAGITLNAGDLVIGTMYASTALEAPYLYRDDVGQPELNTMTTSLTVQGEVDTTGFIRSQSHIGAGGSLYTTQHVRVGCNGLFGCTDSRLTLNGGSGDIKTTGSAYLGCLTGTSCAAPRITLNGGNGDVTAAGHLKAHSLEVNGPWNAMSTFTTGVTFRDVMYVYNTATFKGLSSFEQKVTARQGIDCGTGCWPLSDLSLKENIVPLQGALDKLLRISGVQFTWKDGGKDDLGVIAQDVEAVFPELIRQSQDGTKGVNYNGLAAPLIEAVRELKIEIDALKEEVRELKRR